ncbi:zeta toxin family protein [Sulfurimonas indica]|uniref:zeta toxin family protein n=2 Tax=Sulfurimonas TaxID=202746 RepID=UPI0012656E26|nr:zeta toxin family protein [Sulfurimonas indica]
MKTKQKLEKTAIKYLKENRKDFFNHYISDKFPIDEKIAYFTAGPSGAGKTEFIQKFIEFESNLLHLDIDIIRDFFKPVGYDGKNSDIFQKPASWGVQFLFDEAVKYRGLSLVVDSNFSHLQTAKENMLKLLKQDYKIEIFYIYNDLEKCFLYTKKRESVTNRLVPEDVFLNSVVKSRSVTAEIKKLFGENIALHVIDKRDNSYYKDVSYTQFNDIIPEYKAQI